MNPGELIWVRRGEYWIGENLERFTIARTGARDKPGSRVVYTLWDVRTKPAKWCGQDSSPEPLKRLASNILSGRTTSPCSS